MKAFQIKGTFRLASKREQPFLTEVLGESKVQAKEKLLSDIGSRHYVKRRFITIETIQEIPADKVENLKLRQLLGK